MFKSGLESLSNTFRADTPRLLYVSYTRRNVLVVKCVFCACPVCSKCRPNLVYETPHCSLQTQHCRHRNNRRKEGRKEGGGGGEEEEEEEEEERKKKKKKKERNTKIISTLSATNSQGL